MGVTFRIRRHAQETRDRLGFIGQSCARSYGESKNLPKNIAYNTVPYDFARMLLLPQNAADLVDPQLVLDVVKDDPDDNRVLERAVAGRAD